MSQYSTIIENGLKPDIIDEFSESLTYLGYLKNGDPEKALICKREKTGTVTTFTYPNGQHLYGYKWNDRAALSYSYRKN